MTFEQAVNGHLEAIQSLSCCATEVEAAADLLIGSALSGGKVLWMGNGGSAADAQHYAAELMVRYTRNRKPIASLALTTDSSLLTAHSNDYEYATVFARQVEALASANDVVVGISTSGNSENVELALKWAKANGIRTLALLGRDGGRIKELADVAIVVPNKVTAHIQEAHLVIGHYLCDRVEEACFEAG